MADFMFCYPDEMWEEFPALHECAYITLITTQFIIESREKNSVKHIFALEMEQFPTKWEAILMEGSLPFALPHVREMHFILFFCYV